MPRRFRAWGWSWLTLTAAFALHVADEAANDALAFYNPAIRAVRARYPFLPLPPLTFDIWLTVLVLAVIVLAFMSVLIFRGVTALRYPAYAYAAAMLINSVQHLGASLFMQRLTPGALSAPLLLIASAWLLVETRRVATIGDGDAIDRSPPDGSQ